MFCLTDDIQRGEILARLTETPMRTALLPAALLLSLFTVICAACPASADQIRLKTGRTLEGEVVAETPQQITVKMLIGGTQTINRMDIDRIEKVASASAKFGDRLAAIKSTDVDAYIALGQWAEENNLKNEALQSYLRAAAVASPKYVEAMYHVGMIARDLQDYRLAARCLRDLSDRFKHRPAWIALADTESRLRSERLGFLKAAQDKEYLKQYGPALEAYRQALRCSLNEKTVNAEDPGTADIRALFLRCRAAQALAYIEDIKEPQDVGACSVCNGSGTTTCKRCEGSGKVKVEGKVRVDLLKGEKTVDIEEAKCPDCRGRGTVICPSCQGYGQNIGAFPRQYQDGLASLGRISYQATESGLPMQIVQVENQIKISGPFIPQSQPLNYGGGQAVRSALSAFPPSNMTAEASALAEWKKLEKNDRRNFLISYGLELSAWLNSPLISLDHGGITWAFQPTPENLYVACRQADLDDLRTHPDLFAGSWVKISGPVQPYGRWSDDMGAAFQVGAAEHPDLAVLAWDEPARARHQWYAQKMGDSDKYAHEVSARYPYGKMLDELKKGAPNKARVLYGRVMTRRDTSPFLLFEVWAVEPVADPAMVDLVD